MSNSTADRETEHIDITNPEHIEYWTAQFGITVETLKNLISANGAVAADIRLALGK